MLRTEPQQRQREPDLVVHVAFGPQGPPGRTQDRGGRLLGRGLGDAARDADDEWREPATPARGDGSERGLPIGHAHDRDVAQGCGILHGAGHEHGRGASLDRLGNVVVTVGALAGKRDEQVARCDEARIHGATADRSGGAGQESSAGEAEEVVGREGGRRGVGRRRGRRVDVGHARQCRIAATHRSAALGVVVDGRLVRRSGVVIASVAMRRNSSNDMTGISNWPTRATDGVPSSMRTATTRSGVSLSRAMYPTNE